MARRFETDDEAHDRSVVEFLDDWAEAIEEDRQRAADRRAASGMSPELILLHDEEIAKRRSA